jgi:hypothetical protein
LTSNLEPWEEKFRSSKDSRFVVFLIGNEYYNIKKFEKLSAHP